ncbi:MAG: shikimate kinase [Polyangiaceae bacterium]|jgi:predicted kinase|nr:shikimate kinase [Polyangiaceae bacterium]
MPSLAVVCGNAGTGKTTWAKRVAQRRSAALLDLDTVSERVVMAAQRELGRSENDRDSAEYKRVFRDAVHETLFAIARDCAGPVVIVAPFTLERRLPNFSEWLAGKCGRSVQVHYFVCDEQVREARLRSRGNPRDAAKLEDYAAYRAIAPYEPPPAYPHLRFDTTHAFPGEPELVSSDEG